MGAPRAACPRPPARGQPPVGTTSPDGPARGAPQAARAAPLAADPRDARARRPHIPCPRTGQCRCPLWWALERATPDGCRPVRTCSPTAARASWPATRPRRPRATPTRPPGSACGCGGLTAVDASGQCPGARPCGLGAANPCGRGVGSSCVIPPARLRRAHTFQPAPALGHVRSARRSSSAGPSHPPLRRAERLSGSKRNDRGRMVPSSVPPLVCAASTRSWPCWPMRGTPGGSFPSQGPPGTTRLMPRAPMPWPLSGSLCGGPCVSQQRCTIPP